MAMTISDKDQKEDVAQSNMNHNNKGLPVVRWNPEQFICPQNLFLITSKRKNWKNTRAGRENQKTRMRRSVLVATLASRSLG